MMVPRVQAALEGDAQVQQLLGHPARIWLGQAPPDAQLPCMTWSVLRGAPTPTLAGPPPADEWHVRITVWGTSMSEADQVATVIRDVIERTGSIQSYNPINDEDPRAVGISFDAQLIQLR